MNKLIGAFLAIGLFAGSAGAATLMKTSYKTAQQAAKAAAAYRLDKAAGWARYSASDLRIAKTIDNKGPSQKFQVASKDGSKLFNVSVKKSAPGKYTAYVPNRTVYTPVGSGGR
jgi:hypothetical protein